jgi:hypothetical protein
MQHAVLNHANVRVADTRDVSGRVTVDSINDGSRAERKSSLWRACGLMIFCSVVSVGVLASLTPVSAFADPGGVPAEIAALQKQVAALQTQVSAQQAQITSLQNQLTAAKPVLALAPFVSVDPNPENGVIGPNITFKGANIHIVSGSGATADFTSSEGGLTGLGNLIIGYDEKPEEVPLFGNGSPLKPGDRGGSHNLVIGRFHRFTQNAFGGLVAGDFNTISGPEDVVSGGQLNFASGFATSVSGGFDNFAIGYCASVSGGVANLSNGWASSVLGGFGNTADGDLFPPPEFTNPNGPLSAGSTVVGGERNTAIGPRSVVLGGQNVTNNNARSIAPQPPFP